MVKAKAIILLAISGILFILAAVLVLMNLGNRFMVHLFTTRVEIRVGAGLAWAAIIGGLLWAIWRFCVPRGYRLLKQAQRADEDRRRQERLDRLVAEDDARAAGDAQAATPPESGDKTIS
ncbi:MAG: hypothetical protein GX591_09505 [Planctomycetes bacterium]|nr:hypothetical protein [Planctomycetota bacterium]